MVFGEAAVKSEGVGFAEGAEEAVPPGDVAVVETVNVELVMDGMVLGALDEVAEPARGAKVAVVEVFADYGEGVEPGSGRRRWRRGERTSARWTGWNRGPFRRGACRTR